MQIGSDVAHAHRIVVTTTWRAPTYGSVKTSVPRKGDIIDRSFQPIFHQPFAQPIVVLYGDTIGTAPIQRIGKRTPGMLRPSRGAKLIRT